MNAFVAGKPADGGIEFTPRAGFAPTARFYTDGQALYIDGANVAYRPRGVASKQIRICIDAQGALEMASGSALATTPADAAWLQRARSARLAAANALLSALKAGVGVHEAQDFMEGWLSQYRVLESRWRLGSRGTGGPGVVSAGCLLVEVSEATRKQAVVNMVMLEAARLWNERMQAHGFPAKPARAQRARKLSRAELQALANRARLALERGDEAMLHDAAQRLRDAILTNRSTYFKG